jgi:Protein of unknown function (DUF2934)
MSNNPRSSESSTKPTREQVATRAELLWKAKGSPHGQDEQIWLEAERQLFDEAREILGDAGEGSSSEPIDRSKLSSEEPASPPPSAPKRSQNAEQMTKPGGSARKRGGNR